MDIAAHDHTDMMDAVKADGGGAGGSLHLGV